MATPGLSTSGDISRHDQTGLSEDTAAIDGSGGTALEPLPMFVLDDTEDVNRHDVSGLSEDTAAIDGDQADADPDLNMPSGGLLLTGDVSKHVIDPLRPVPAGARKGSGTSIQLMINQIVDSQDGLDDDSGLSDLAVYQDTVGTPLSFDYDWQQKDTTMDWPVTLKSTWGIQIEDPSLIESFDINAAGADCDVSVEIAGTSSSSSDGLIFIDLEWTYNCPTDTTVTVKPVVDEDKAEDLDSLPPMSILPTPPTMEDGFGPSSGGSWGGGFSGIYSWSMPQSERLSMISNSCTPPGETSRSEIRIKYTTSQFQSYELDLGFDPSKVNIVDVHADDTVFAERNEDSSYNYSHKMGVDSYSIDNTNGNVSITASSGTAIGQSIYTMGYQTIMTSIEIEATGQSGDVEPFDLDRLTLYDPDGAELAVTHNLDGFRIDNGITVESANLKLGETGYSAVTARIGEQFDTFRTVMRFDPDVADTIDVVPIPSDCTITGYDLIPSEEATNDDHPSNEHYAIVEGEFGTATRMTDLFDYKATAYSEDQLVERAESDDKDAYPSQTDIVVLDKDDVSLLNTEYNSDGSDSNDTGDPDYSREVKHVPTEELPEPHFDGTDSGIVWGCSNGGAFDLQSIETVEETGDGGGYEIPETGIVYWPIIFDMAINLPGIPAEAITTDDIRVETTSDTNPAISHKVHSPVSTSGGSIVPITIVIPKADPQEYPVDFALDMWIGGKLVTFVKSGLHVGGDLSQGTHQSRMVGGKVVKRFGVGGGPF